MPLAARENRSTAFDEKEDALAAVPVRRGRLLALGELLYCREQARQVLAVHQALEHADPVVADLGPQLGIRPPYPDAGMGPP